MEQLSNQARIKKTALFSHSVTSEHSTGAGLSATRRRTIIIKVVSIVALKFIHSFLRITRQNQIKLKDLSQHHKRQDERTITIFRVIITKAIHFDMLCLQNN